MLVSLLRSIQARSDMICKKTSSLQGMVRPPIGWWYPYSSSALLSKSWNEGWFKHSIWITNRFFSSPTYTARYPFGTSAPFDTACLALLTPSKRKPMVFVFCLLLHTHNTTIEWSWRTCMTNKCLMLYDIGESGMRGIYMVIMWITLLTKLNGYCAIWV